MSFHKNKWLLRKIWNWLCKNDYFYIVSHINPDGDSICSIFAFSEILKKLKKIYKVILQNLPTKYQFLSAYYKKNKNDFNPQNLVVIDSPELLRLGEVLEKIDINKLQILNIDHHIGNKKFGNLNLVDSTASSCCELIFELLLKNGVRIDKKIALLLYVGIVTDTRYFTQQNTTANTHKVVAELLRTGIRAEKIANILNLKSIAHIKFLASAINNMKIANGILYSYLSREDFNKINAPEEHVDGVIEFLRDVENVDIAILFRDTNKNKIKVSFRTNRDINLYKIAKLIGGGGHKKAAAATLDGDFAEVRDKVMAILTNYKNKLQ